MLWTIACDACQEEVCQEAHGRCAVGGACRRAVHRASWNRRRSARGPGGGRRGRWRVAGDPGARARRAGRLRPTTRHAKRPTLELGKFDGGGVGIYLGGGTVVVVLLVVLIVILI